VTRLTITLSEPRYRALKETAAQRGKTIGQLVDESLDFYGVKSRGDALELVRRARLSSGLDEDQALALALDEVQQMRWQR
jgi:predicted DNA-binding ribbon-helix-helix protein